MCIDVINFVCRSLRAPESSLHRLSRSDSRGVRLRDVKIIRGNPVADNFCEDRRTPLSSKLKIFQRENGGTFPQHHAGPISIKRAALLRRRRLK
jgi:hypothetical protein